MLDGTAAPGVHLLTIGALAVPDWNRLDAAEAMIRLEHSRERFAGLPSARGRWGAEAGGVGHRAVGVCGEVAITLRDLPADRVAMLGALTVPSQVLGDRSLIIVLRMPQRPRNLTNVPTTVHLNRKSETFRWKDRPAAAADPFRR